MGLYYLDLRAEKKLYYKELNVTLITALIWVLFKAGKAAEYHSILQGFIRK